MRPSIDIHVQLYGCHFLLNFRLLLSRLSNLVIVAFGDVDDTFVGLVLADEFAADTFADRITGRGLLLLHELVFLDGVGLTGTLYLLELLLVLFDLLADLTWFLLWLLNDLLNRFLIWCMLSPQRDGVVLFHSYWLPLSPFPLDRGWLKASILLR